MYRVKRKLREIGIFFAPDEETGDIIVKRRGRKAAAPGPDGVKLGVREETYEIEFSRKGHPSKADRKYLVKVRSYNLNGRKVRVVQRDIVEA